MTNELAYPISFSLLAFLLVLALVALQHSDEQVRKRAERILLLIFRVR
ncbi:hypothetical protein ACH4UT_24035 [Streptomyces sp. NPDC020799]